MRPFVPSASRAWVVDGRNGSVVCELPKPHAAGLSADPPRDRRQPFRHRLQAAVGEVEIEFGHSYQFPLLMREAELDLFKKGNHFQIHRLLGAHPQTVDGVSGVVFAVWAPNARRVSVVGNFNNWDGRHHPMRLRPEYGVWEIFIPRIGIGELYKYEIKSKSGEVLPLKADPCGFYAERPPATASIVYKSDFKWHDEQWMAHREKANARKSPISIYEVHLGSWRRARNGQYLTYHYESSASPTSSCCLFQNIPSMGRGVISPIGLFAPTSRYGTPDDLRHLVQCCHEASIGVLLDWVPGHFPSDPHGLGLFDGTCLYEHADPRKGRHPDWQTLIYNFGRHEVAAFLISNALYWIREFHIDGLRVDAVASMLYLDYSRKPDEWLPNQYGGRENLEALAFIRRLNEAIYVEGQGAVPVAENRPRGRWCRARLIWAALASATNGTWGGCTIPSTIWARTRSTENIITTG